MAVSTEAPTTPLPHYPLYLSVTAAATRLHRSPGTVRRWLRDGRLRGRKVERGGPGGTWEVSEESCSEAATEITAVVDTAIDVAATPVDTLTLNAIEQLTQAIQELTVELRQERLLPAAKEEKPRPWWKVWGNRQCPVT